MQLLRLRPLVLTVLLCVGATALRAATEVQQAWTPATTLDLLPMSAAAVAGRAGYDLTAPFQDIAMDGKQRREVRVAPSDRLELRMNAPIEQAWLVANGELRPLPIGAHLDAAAGVFTWVAPVGYYGRYDLEFVAGGGRIPVSVDVRYDRATRPAELHVDPIATTIARLHVVTGWAYDEDAFTGTGVSAVHVWAVRRDASEDAQFLGAAALNIARDDIGVRGGVQPGFALTLRPLRRGDYDLYVFAWSDRARAWCDAQVLTLGIR